MSLELAAQMIDQLTQQVNQLNMQVTQLTTRSTSTDEEHNQVHAKLVHTQAQLAQMNTWGGKGEIRLIDPKSMIPDKLGTDKSPWRQGCLGPTAWKKSKDSKPSSHRETLRQQPSEHTTLPK